MARLTVGQCHYGTAVPSHPATALDSSADMEFEIYSLVKLYVTGFVHCDSMRFLSLPTREARHVQRGGNNRSLLHNKLTGLLMNRSTIYRFITPSRTITELGTFKVDLGGNGAALAPYRVGLLRMLKKKGLARPPWDRSPKKSTTAARAGMTIFAPSQITDKNYLVHRNC
jgi:hypothetical protein